MGGADFWSLKPVLLEGDAAGVRARRVLAKLIADEQPESAKEFKGSGPVIPRSNETDTSESRTTARK
jgi:hypothetical protein